MYDYSVEGSFSHELGLPSSVFTKLFRVKLSGLLTKTQPRTHTQDGTATGHHAFQPHVRTLTRICMIHADASRSRPPFSPCLCSSCRKHADDASTMHARALRAPISSSMIISRLCVHNHIPIHDTIHAGMNRVSNCNMHICMCLCVCVCVRARLCVCTITFLLI